MILVTLIARNIVVSMDFADNRSATTVKIKGEKMDKTLVLKRERFVRVPIKYAGRYFVTIKHNDQVYSKNLTIY